MVFILFRAWPLTKAFGNPVSKTATHPRRMAAGPLWILISVVKEASSLLLFQQQDTALALGL